VNEDLPLSGNVLQVGLVHLRTGGSDEPARVFKLVSTVADRRVRLMPLGSEDESEVRGFVAQSSVLSYTVVLERFLLYLDITGTLGVYDAMTSTVVSKQKYHTKYGVRIITETSPLGLLVATAGWDRKVQVAFLDTNRGGDFTGQLPLPAASLMLDSVVDDVLFRRNVDTGQLFLIVTRRDSCFLYYYSVDDSSHDVKLALAGKQNLAPYANSWNTFSPACIRPCPTDSGLIAVAMSSVPHMKLLFVRLLFPGTVIAARESPLDHLSSDLSSKEDSGSQEAMAILVQCNTMVGQTQYSVPQVTWRPDGSGVWVNSDDGLIKGIDLTGKVMSTLNGHVGSRVRCLFAGMLSGREVLMSGAFDQKVITWNIDEAD
jgi:hypothetical protein